MSDNQRDGGGLAVLVIGGILGVVLMLACGGVGFVLYQRLAISQEYAIEEVMTAAEPADEAAPIETTSPETQ